MSARRRLGSCYESEHRMEISRGGIASFAVLLVRLDLLQLETRAGEEKRSREVVPHRVAGEVEAMQLIPWGLPHMTGEGSARISALIDDLAGAVFDPNSIRCEVTAMVRPRVWADRDSRPPRVDPHGDVRHPFWVSLEMIKRACQRDAHVEAFHFTPTIETAVCFQGEVEKVAHIFPFRARSSPCGQQSAGHRRRKGPAPPAGGSTRLGRPDEVDRSRAPDVSCSDAVAAGPRGGFHRAGGRKPRARSELDGSFRELSADNCNARLRGRNRPRARVDL